MTAYWKFLLFSLVTSYPMGSCGWKSIQSNHNLAKCLHDMMFNDNSSFVKHHVRISVAADSKKNSWKFFDIVDELLASYNNCEMMFDIRKNNTNKSKEFNVHKRIMFVDSFEAFERLVKLQRSHATNVSGLFQYFYVVLQTSVTKLNRILRRITHFCLENMIAHINILVEDAQGVITIYSYYPFTPTSCRNSKPVVYNYYKNGTFTWLIPIFPLKFTNLWKCPLKAVLWDQAPFVQNIRHLNRMFGVDISVLNYLASNLNFTWKTIVSPYKPNNYNGSLTSSFKMLSGRRPKGDLLLGGSGFVPERLSNFAATGFYFLTKVELVLKVSEENSSVSVLLFPFDGFTWLIMLAVFVGKWILHHGLRNRTSRNCKFHIRISSKVLKLSWLLSVLIIRSSYEGLIYKYLHENSSKKFPQNLDEAIADGYTFVCSEPIYNVYLKEQLEIKKDRIEILKMPITDIILEFLKLDGKYALITFSTSFTIFKNKMSAFKNGYPHWIVVKKPVLTSYGAMYMSKFSFLHPIMKDRISNIMTNGIHEQIYQDEIKSVLDRILYLKSNHLPQGMSMLNLLGAFHLLAAMLGLAGGILLMEIISVRNKRIQRIMNFFH